MSDRQPPASPDPQQPYGQQPYGQQPYPGQNYPGQGAPGWAGTPAGPTGYNPIPGGPGGAVGPGGYPATGPGGPSWNPYAQGAPVPPPKKSSGGKLAIILGAVGLVVVLIVVGTVLAVSRSQQADPGTSTGGGSTGPSDQATIPAPAATAADAVRSYLQALSTGDADTALALSVDPPTEKTLLTSAVLVESNRIAPITAVEVTDPGSQSASSVAVSYRIGSTPVQEAIPVTKIGDEWKLARTFSWLDLSAATAYGRLPVTVNKTKVTRTTVNVFPGAYAFASTSKYLRFSKNTVTVAGVVRTSSATGLSMALTSAGSDHLRSTARKSLENCMKQRKLHPSNCPLGVNPGGYKVDAKTLRWKRSGPDPLKSSKVRFDASTLEAATTFRLKLDGTIRCRSSVGSGTCTVKINSNRTATIQFDDPNRVYWR
ncbi:MAG TPA: hypothetical protein VFP34_17360 [Microlunatus sp.]|nr:hypothetical protein [Microlunatus sp.]